MSSILKSVTLVALSMAEPVYGASQGAAGEAEAVLAERADRLCSQMLVRFLRSPAGVGDLAVRKALAGCYVAEARLVVLGSDRALLDGHPALVELPSRKLAQDGAMVLDPYRPLASVRFVAPASPGAGE